MQRQVCVPPTALTSSPPSARPWPHPSPRQAAGPRYFSRARRPAGSGRRRAFWLLSLVAAGCLPFAAGAVTGDPATAGGVAAPLPPGDEVIARWMAAAGGDALLAVRTEQRSGTVLRGQAGRMPVRTAATAAGQWLWHITFSYGDQLRFGCDGADAWIQDTRGVQEMSAAQRFDLQLLLDPLIPSKLRSLCPYFSTTGIEQVGEREAYTIQATTLEGIRMELAFDRETGLLLRAGSMLFEDYREAAGVTRPYRVRLGESDEEHPLRITLEFTATEHNVDVDQTTFARPRDALPITEAPLYRTRKEAVVSPEALDACIGVYQHPEQAGVTYTVTRMGEHLMLQRTGWPTEREIVPESETEYFIRFPGTDFRFVKDAAGKITMLDIANGAVKAPRIQ